MLRAKITAVAATLVLSAIGIGGCGLKVQLTASPANTVAGGSVNLTLSLTNPSQCPVGGVEAALIPFATAQDLEFVGDPEIVEIIEGLINAACTGQPVMLPGGITCNIVDNQLVCTIGGDETGPGTSGELTVKGPGGGTLLTCQRNDTTVTCQLPFLQNLAGADISAGLTLPLSCMPMPSEVPGTQLCTTSQIDAGGTSSTTLTLPAPSETGLFRSLLFAVATETGVCKAGTNQGEPCSSDSDCSGTSGSCGSGICVNNTTQATDNGCTSTSDCNMNEMCVQCAPSGPGVIVPLACAETTVSFSAPEASNSSRVALIVVLLGIGFFGLRRWRRASGG